MNFRDTRLNLLAYVRNQVRNGEITERGFARLIGISQPHAHNVLKGVRSLSPDLCDLALKYLHLSLLDLTPLNEIEAQLKRRCQSERVAPVAFLETPVGPGHVWPEHINANKSFPVPFTSPALSAEFLMAELTPDPAMTSTLQGCDIALIDISQASRCFISPRDLYIVDRDGEAVLRYIRSGERSYYLVTDADYDRPLAWERVPRATAKASGLVKARVVWLGREREGDTLVQRGRFLSDPISS